MAIKDTIGLYDGSLKRIAFQPNQFVLEIAVEQTAETLNLSDDLTIRDCTIVRGHNADKLRWKRADKHSPPDGSLCRVNARVRFGYPDSAVYSNGVWTAYGETLKVIPSMKWRLYIAGIDAP